MKYIASTLSASVQYTAYAETGGDLPAVAKTVTIAGGAGVANKHFVTPRGVITNVDDADVKMLLANPIFKIHMANGYVQILDSVTDGDAAAADMTGRDNSAPLVNEDFEKAPVTARKGK